MRRKKKKSGPIPAAPAGGPTGTWPAEGGGRAESRPSAPGTTALSLAWGGEAYCRQTGTGEHAEEERRREVENRKGNKERRQEKTRGG